MPEVKDRVRARRLSATRSANLIRAALSHRHRPTARARTGIRQAVRIPFMRVYRAAALVHLVGDFATGEDVVQDAVEAALTHWPVEGIPDRPDAWLYTVAATGVSTCSVTSAATGTRLPSCRGRPSRSPTTGYG